MLLAHVERCRLLLGARADANERSRAGEAFEGWSLKVCGNLLDVGPANHWTEQEGIALPGGFNHVLVLGGAFLARGCRAWAGFVGPTYASTQLGHGRMLVSDCLRRTRRGSPRDCRSCWAQTHSGGACAW